MQQQHIQQHHLRFVQQCHPGGALLRPASTPLPYTVSSLDGHGAKPPPPLASALNLCGLEDSSVEDIVSKSCRDILVEAANQTLKAVELANTLRARVGTEVLAHIRERWGGLLSLLERHPHMFRVERIPKNDLVSLVAPGTMAGGGGSMFALSAMEREALGASIRGSSNMGSPNNINGIYADRRSSPPIPSTSSPPPVFTGDAFSVSSMGSSMGGEREGAVSRCLHVGNVPVNMTEAQLMRELERYGEVDGLKLGECCCREKGFA